MTDLEDFSKGFLAGWLKTLMESLDKNLDEETRLKIFKDTGTFCAKAHATELFKEIKLKTHDPKELMTMLNEKLKGTTWEIIDEGKLKVIYERCFCPIVGFGLHKSEVQCDCSIGWLKKNLEILFNKDVDVELKDSVLRGGSKCEFLVDF
jgi:predicted hydrocarbon binding protein